MPTELIWLQDPMVFQRYIFVQVLASILPQLLTTDSRRFPTDTPELVKIAIDMADQVAREATIKAFNTETNKQKDVNPVGFTWPISSDSPFSE